MAQLHTVKSQQELHECLAHYQNIWPKKNLGRGMRHVPGKRALEIMYKNSELLTWAEFVYAVAAERFEIPEEDKDRLTALMQQEDDECEAAERDLQEQLQKVDPDADPSNFVFLTWWVGGCRGTATSRGCMVERYLTAINDKRVQKKSIKDRKTENQLQMSFVYNDLLGYDMKNHGAIQLPEDIDCNPYLPPYGPDNPPENQLGDIRLAEEYARNLGVAGAAAAGPGPASSRQHLAQPPAAAASPKRKKTSAKKKAERLLPPDDSDAVDEDQNLVQNTDSDAEFGGWMQGSPGADFGYCPRNEYDDFDDGALLNENGQNAIFNGLGLGGDIDLTAHEIFATLSKYKITAGRAKIMGEGANDEELDAKARKHRARMWASRAELTYMKAMLIRDQLELMQMWWSELYCVPKCVALDVFQLGGGEEGEKHWSTLGLGPPVASDPGQRPELEKCPRVWIRLVPDGTDYGDLKVQNVVFHVMRPADHNPRILIRVVGGLPTTTTGGGAINFLTDMLEGCLARGVPFPGTWTTTTKFHGAVPRCRPCLALCTDSGSDMIKLATLVYVFVCSIRYNNRRRREESDKKKKQASPSSSVFAAAGEEPESGGLQLRSNFEPDWHFNWIPCCMHLLHLVVLTVLDQMSAMTDLPLTKTLTAVTKTVNWYFTERGEKKGVIPELEIKKVRAFVRTRWGSTTDTISDILNQKELLSSDELHRRAHAYMAKVAKTNRKFYQRACEVLRSDKWWEALESCDIVLQTVKQIMVNCMAASRLENNSLEKVRGKLPNPTDEDLLASKLRSTYTQLHKAGSKDEAVPGWGPVSLCCHAVAGALNLREKPMKENGWHQLKYIVGAHEDLEAAYAAAKRLKKKVQQGLADSLIVEAFELFPGEMQQWVERKRQLPSKAFAREFGGAVPSSVNSSQSCESRHFSTGYVKQEGGGNTGLRTANCRTTIRTSTAAFPFSDFKSIYEKELSCWASRKKTANSGDLFSNSEPKVISAKASEVMQDLFEMTKQKPGSQKDADRFPLIYPRGDKAKGQHPGGGKPLDMKKLDVKPGDLVIVAQPDATKLTDLDAHAVITTNASDATLVAAEDTDVSLAKVVMKQVDADMAADTEYVRGGWARGGATTLSILVNEAAAPLPKKTKVDDGAAAPAPASSSSTTVAKAKSTPAKAAPKAKSKPKAPAPAAAGGGAALGVRILVLKEMAKHMYYHFGAKQQRLRITREMVWQQSGYTLASILRERRQSAGLQSGNVFQRVLAASPGRRTAKDAAWKSYNMYAMVPEIEACGIPKTTQVFYITYSLDSKMWNCFCHRFWEPGMDLNELAKKTGRIDASKFFGRSDRKEAMKVACDFWEIEYKDATEAKQEFAVKYLKKYVSANAKHQLEKDLRLNEMSDSEEGSMSNYHLGLEMIAG
mmetsp:Transcript_27080/g.68279  ORF Transcript_27080/g.68279 Transcript_27080/m.68279 type:complete len:1404 (+) Transcript_27080:327-4538(+)|eukprot:CAMPEP_0178997594 /NCGR_PEP_ID=MMETSP0795-20121207/9033_1 /TAXON_ID=88552 /ORGANISM="Amoebophrya sp., Strain Ameob2" /LENGTH=1403 /DNA_ID=CAMNT_0020690157 /DNA_START=312 /DNA_END=4523 /DNA_ORIENTATION=-